jgi:hypothetical protein
MSNDAYRDQLLRSVSILGATEARQLSEEQLHDAICLHLGLPLGTRFTTEQLDRIAEADL